MTFPKVNNAMLDIGVAANQLVQLTSAGKLPALNASQLTNLPSSGSSSPGIILLATQVISSPVSQLDFTSNLDATYKEYILRGADISISANTLLGLRIRIGGTFKSNNGYPHSCFGVGNATGGFGFSNAGDDHLLLMPGNASSYGADSNIGFITNITNPAGTARCKGIHTTGGGKGANSNAGFAYSASGGWNGGAQDFSAFDGLRIFANSGTINSGIFKLYGVA